MSLRRPLSGIVPLVLAALSCSEVLARQPTPAVSSSAAERPESNLTTGGNQTESPPPSIKQLAAERTLYKVGRDIRKYGVPILVTIGLMGNLLSFVVMIQPINRRISCCIYMVAVSVCDAGVLLSVIAYWSTTYGIKLVQWTNMQCKFAGYSFTVCSMSSVILVTFVTVDRFIAVRYPLRAKEYCSTSRAKKICVGIIILVTICQLPHLHYFLQKGPICQAFGFRDKYAVTFVWFNMALNSLIPFTVLCVLNGFIMATVLGRAKSFSAGGEDRAGGEKDGGMGARDRQMVTMLLLVTSALLVFTMPQCVRYIAYLFIDHTRDVHSFALYIFWYNTSLTLFVINYSINFFLYCMGGSKFRDDLREILTCRRK